MGTASMSRRWGWLAFALIWVLTSLYVLRHFYVLGGMRDSLWFAGLAHHGDLALSDPPSVAFAHGASFFHTHFSPIFYLPSALSRLSPLPPAAWYALWYGAMHGLLALSFWALLAPLARRAACPAAGAIAAALACLFALQGNAMVALQMPHFELLIPALMVGVMALVLRARTRAAMALLALTILVREDAGLHVAALFCPAYLWLRWRTPPGHLNPMAKAIGQLGLMGLVGACACLALQKLGWGDNGMLVRNYLGSPPLAHLNAALVQARWAIFVHERSYLWLPALLCLAWAGLARRALIAWGFVACLPWLALQFVAKEPVMGSLSWYYAFPAIASLAWPLVAVRVVAPDTSVQAARRTLVWMAILLLSTLAGQVNGRPMVYAWQIARQLTWPMATVAADEAFMEALEAQVPRLGQLRVDNGVIALRPHAFRADQRAEIVGIETQPIDTLVWFDPGGFDSNCWALADSQGLRHRFAIPHSPIVIASRQDLLASQDKAWQGMLVRTNLFARRTLSSLPAAAVHGGWRVEPGTPEGVVIQAPLLQRTDGLYDIPSVSLPPGMYQLVATIRVDDVDTLRLPLFELRRSHEWAPQLNETLSVDRSQLTDLGQGRYRITWPLVMPSPPQGGPGGYWPGLMQLAWHHAGRGGYTIEGWALERR